MLSLFKFLNSENLLFKTRGKTIWSTGQTWVRQSCMLLEPVWFSAWRILHSRGNVGAAEGTWSRAWLDNVKPYRSLWRPHRARGTEPLLWTQGSSKCLAQAKSFDSENNHVLGAVSAKSAIRSSAHSFTGCYLSADIHSTLGQSKWMRQVLAKAVFHFCMRNRTDRKEVCAHREQHLKLVGLWTLGTKAAAALSPAWPRTVMPVSTNHISQFLKPTPPWLFPPFLLPSLVWFHLSK